MQFRRYDDNRCSVICKAIGYDTMKRLQESTMKEIKVWKWVTESVYKCLCIQVYREVYITYSRIAASSTVDTSLEVLTATLQIQIFETA